MLGETVLAEYTYDDLNRRTQVFYNNDGPVDADYETDFVYDYEDAAGADDDLGMDIEGVHNHWASSVNMNITYMRDKVGNITSKYINGHSTDDRYVYDALYQVQNVYYGYTPPNGPANSTVVYNYDVLGNRNTVSYDSVIEQYYRSAYNDLNQYSSVVYNSQSRTIAYDVNGNMTMVGSSKTFTYDYLNRMTSATVDATTYTYAYDAFGRRVYKDDGTTETVYVYDGAQIIAEYTIVGETPGKLGTVTYFWRTMVAKPLDCG